MRGQKRGQNEKAKRKVADFQRLKNSFCDPLGIKPRFADYYGYVLKPKHLHASYSLTFISTSNCLIILYRLQR